MICQVIKLIIFIYLLLLCILTCSTSNIIREDCTKNAVFYLVAKGYKLIRAPIQDSNVTAPKDCFRKCIGERICRSVVVCSSAIHGLTCYLYDIDQQSRELRVIERKECDYYDSGPSTSKVGHTCRSKEKVCEKAFCVEECNKRGFSCKNGKSCKEIRTRFGDSKLSNGFYVLNMTEGNMKVFCDMKNIGGGWLRVAYVKVNTNSSDMQKFDNFEANFNALAYPTKNFVLSSFALKTLWNQIKFTQIRFFCRKVKVGRTFHIQSYPNTTKVIDWYLSRSTEFPRACTSFVALSDDTSELSKNCHLWGTKSAGIIGPSHTLYDGAMWLSYKNHWNTYPKGLELRFECDDIDRNGDNIFKGDIWKVFIR